MIINLKDSIVFPAPSWEQGQPACLPAWDILGSLEPPDRTRVGGTPRKRAGDMGHEGLDEGLKEAS